jgi:hypothetical protein
MGESAAEGPRSTRADAVFSITDAPDAPASTNVRLQKKQLAASSFTIAWHFEHRPVA